MPSSNSFATADRPSEIIEHMQAESEERYRTLFDLAPSPSILVMSRV
jgi:hypothetical protein